MRAEIIAGLRILALCVGAAIAYGVLHDLVTAHVCVEYFSIGHPEVIASENPILLALVWGVLGTWYVGVVLAIPLYCGARLGAAPAWPWRRLVRPLALLLAAMAVGALVAGVVGHGLARRNGWALPGALGDLVARERHARFIADWCAHAASYGIGFLGGLVLPVVVWIRRGPAGGGTPAARATRPRPPAGLRGGSAMTGFIEPHPDLVQPNPGGSDDPLGESVLNPEQPWLRVFEPGAVRLVLGRSQDPRRELLVDAAMADGVPIHRRICGGGAVVLAPGMAVVAIRLRNSGLATNAWFDLVNAALASAVAAVAGVTPTTRGHGDLAISDEGGVERKILGASLRQTSRLVVYLGVLLVADAVPLMERYLAAPSREPDYRGGRGHRAFCDSLSRLGVTGSALLPALERECRTRLGPYA